VMTCTIALDDDLSDRTQSTGFGKCGLTWLRDWLRPAFFDDSIYGAMRHRSRLTPWRNNLSSVLARITASTLL